MQHRTNAALPSANRVQVRPSRLLIVVAAQCVASSASFETMRGCPEGWPREVGPNGGQLCRKKDRESMEWICADCWKQLAGEPWCAPSGTCSASPPSAATLDNLLMLREPTSLPSLPMFWHIPKAAGTAMEALLVFLYNKTILIHEQASPTEATWKRVKAGGKVAGEDSPWVVHEPTEITAAEVAAAAEQSGGAKLAIMTDLPFINLPLLKTVRCRLFAVFRQPVTRVVSLFNYLQTATWEPTYGKIPSKFEAYIESSTFESRWLTTALALPPEKWAMADALGSKRLLAEAKRTLSRFCLVGLFDRLPESLTRFETYFNLPHTGSPGLRARFTTGDGAWNQAAKAADNRTRLVEGTPLWTKASALQLSAPAEARLLTSVSACRLKGSCKATWLSTSTRRVSLSSRQVWLLPARVTARPRPRQRPRLGSRRARNVGGVDAAYSPGVQPRPGSLHLAAGMHAGLHAGSSRVATTADLAAMWARLSACTPTCPAAKGRRRRASTGHTCSRSILAQAPSSDTSTPKAL